MSELVNKVKQSKLKTVDLEKVVSGFTLFELDLKDFLFQGLILKEKDFREKLEEHIWQRYENGYLTVYCSTDAIIPTWAFMLVTQYAKPYAIDILYGNRQKAETEIYKKKIEAVDWSQYEDGYVMLKGCSKLKLTPEIYMHATNLIIPHVKKLMYGEACSNVPVYRDKNG
ncbi:MAG: DUF2480 family protein [Balneolaceae bacterium]